MVLSHGLLPHPISNSCHYPGGLGLSRDLPPILWPPSSQSTSSPNTSPPLPLCHSPPTHLGLLSRLLSSNHPLPLEHQPLSFTWFTLVLSHKLPAITAIRLDSDSNPPCHTIKTIGFLCHLFPLPSGAGEDPPRPSPILLLPEVHFALFALTPHPVPS